MVIKYVANTWDTYFYEKNLQGDIIAVYDANGVKKVSYVYNAWGATTTTYHNGASASTVSNPFTYRGYYYDKDIALYITGVRYYDPVIGRFTNVDSLINGVNGSLYGYNMFAYCFNNPINMSDPSGSWPQWIEWINDTIIQPMIYYFDPDTYTLSGNFTEEIVNGSGSLNGGYSETNCDNGFEGNVSVGNANGCIGIAYDAFSAYIKGELNALNLDGKAAFTYKKGVGVGVKAKASVLSTEGTFEFNILGYELEIGGTADLLSVGAELTIGVFPDEGFKAKSNVGLGIFGVGFIFRIKESD